ncbi:MAG: type II secretion system protein M [Marinagarivorans sp.]|nr:type II secretion system protein M [Marinagarivorans sp.]
MNDFKNWFLQNSQREQLLISVGSVLVILALLYMLVLVPMTKSRDKQVINNRAVLAQQQQVRELAAQYLGEQQSGGGQPMSLAQLINTSLSHHGLRMDDFQPTGEQDVRVRLDRVEYNKVMAWLDELENKKGVQIKEVSVAVDEVAGLLSTVTVKLYRN